jgi:hypothetical protein
MRRYCSIRWLKNSHRKRAGLSSLLSGRWRDYFLRFPAFNRCGSHIIPAFVKEMEWKLDSKEIK